MNSELQEKLLRYIENDLPTDERKAFENELNQSTELKKDLLAYQSIMAGIAQAEKLQMKQSISAATANILLKDTNKYKPGKNGGGGSWVSTFIKIIFFGLIVSAFVFFALLMTDNLPFENEKLDGFKQQIIEYEQSIIKIDTIYHEVTVEQYKDTVLYGEEELENYLEQVDSGGYQ